MKANLKLLLGLMIAVSITTSVYAGGLPVRSLHNMKRVSNAEFAKFKHTDTFTNLFAYDTHNEGGYNYSVKVYFVDYDVTTGSYTLITPTQDITITIPPGTPVSGTYVFPAGASSHEFGSFDFGTTPISISITTNPTSYNGLGIYQVLEYFGGD